MGGGGGGELKPILRTKSRPQDSAFMASREHACAKVARICTYMNWGNPCVGLKINIKKIILGSFLIFLNEILYLGFMYHLAESVLKILTTNDFTEN